MERFRFLLAVAGSLRAESLYAGLTTGAAIVAALAALVTAVVAIGTLYATRLDSQERTRPVLTARFVPGPLYPKGRTYLVIKNNGPTVARDVRVTFDPEIVMVETAKDGKPDMAAPYLHSRYSKPIPVVAPGEELMNIYAGPDRTPDPTNTSRPTNPYNVPDEVTVTITYRSNRLRRRQAPYRDSFRLVLATLYDQTLSLQGDDNLPLQRIARSLESVSMEVWKQQR